MEAKNLAAVENNHASMAVTSGFATMEGFQLLQRISNMFAKSSLVPKTFQGNLPDCAIAVNMAQRLNADPLMVMQNLYVVYGTPSWSSKFLIAVFNQCGRYTSIHYEMTGELVYPYDGAGAFYGPADGGRSRRYWCGNDRR